jgi:hypothetical protein
MMLHKNNTSEKELDLPPKMSYDVIMKRASIMYNIKFSEIWQKIVLNFGEICGWLGLVLIHGSTLPITYGAIMGDAVALPPLSMVLFIWSGLLLFFIRSAIVKDRLYMVSNGLGFFLQSIVLALLVFK